MTTNSTMQTGRVFTAVMMALFIVILLTMTMFGAHTFASTYALKTSTDTTRLGCSLLANIVHGEDAAGALSTANGPEGPVLVLAEHTDNGDFETRLYAYQGKVVQEYALAGSELVPESATPVVDSETFTFTNENGVLTICTDQGSTSVALRSDQGGE